MKTFSTAVLGALALVSFGVSAENVPPTDPQIAAIVVTANQVDIDAGKLAKSMTKNMEVKKFAQLMITDHTGVNKSAPTRYFDLGVYIDF